MITLYQFPISHYCEKVRWALDFKQLPYTPVNLIPGLHIKTILKLAKRSSVPVLVDSQINSQTDLQTDSAEKNISLQGSEVILNHLDTNYPKLSLITENPALNQEINNYEKHLDEQLGVAVRCACYHVLLEHPKIVIPFLAHQGPWYGTLFLKFSFKKLVAKMRQYMKINEGSYLAAVKTIEQHVNDLQNRLVGNQYLFNNQFTRADLTAASLLAPLAMPEGYGLNWPDEIPPRLAELVEKHQPIMSWVRDIYKKHR